MTATTKKARPNAQSVSAPANLHEPAMRLDITADICPITWVKTKLALETLDAGDVLQLRLNQGEPLRNVPMSAKEEGHRVLSVSDNGDASFTLAIRKDGLL